MASITLSGRKEDVQGQLNEMESPATDDPHYADFCHLKQHVLDFVARAAPSAPITVSGSTGIDGNGKRYASVTLSEG